VLTGELLLFGQLQLKKLFVYFLKRVRGNTLKRSTATIVTAKSVATTTATIQRETDFPSAIGDEVTVGVGENIGVAVGMGDAVGRCVVAVVGVRVGVTVLIEASVGVGVGVEVDVGFNVTDTALEMGEVTGVEALSVTVHVIECEVPEPV